MTSTLGPLRSVAPVRRRSGWGWERFSWHWRHTHAEIAGRMAGLSGYVQGHAHPAEQPVSRPESWSYDGCPLATFPDLAAIELLRNSPAYHSEAVPDEAVFTERSSMRAVLLAGSFGRRPSETLAAGWTGRTLLVFAAAVPADVSAGRRLKRAVGLLPGADEALGCRWSAAVDAEAGLSPEGSGERAFDGLLEVWFPTASSATATATALAESGDLALGPGPTADLGGLDSVRFALVVRENRVK